MVTRCACSEKVNCESSHSASLKIMFGKIGWYKGRLPFYLYAVGFVVFSFSFYSCSGLGSGDLGGNNTTDQTAYKLVINNSNSYGLQPQYSNYCFVPGERRKVYLFGTFDNSSYSDERDLYLYFRRFSDCILTYVETANTGTNKYTELNNGRIKYSFGSVYDYPLDQSTSCGDYFQMGNGTSSTRVAIPITPIAERKYNIKYFYTPGNDLTGTTPIAENFLKQASKVYGEAGTTINIVSKTPLDQSLSIIDVSNANKPPAEAIMDFLKLIRPPLFFENDNDVFIFSLDSVITKIEDYNIMGQTSNYHYSTVGLSASFIFNARINKLGLSSASKNKYVTFCAVHELGHARGHNFRKNSQNLDIGYWDYDITDSPHIHGHKGTGSKFCIMKDYGVGTSMETMLNNLHFCEGHLQMLFNTDW